jgi:hypothetical protein
MNTETIGDDYTQRNDRPTYMAPETRCLEKVQQKGFTDQYTVEHSALVCLNTNRVYGPREIAVVNFYRFEGISNPDDMSILYAIETTDGRKGTLIDAYGLYADDAIGELMNEVQRFQKITHRGWE